MEQIMIFNPFTPIPKSDKSHVRGWSQHWAECLNTTVANKSTTLSGDLYLDHGVNFGGTLNLFGGVTDEILDRLIEMIDCSGQLYSLDIDMPDYDAMLKKRGVIVPGLQDKLSNSITLKQSNFHTKYKVYGDSHATAFAPLNSHIIRVNGLTLYRALEDKLIPEDADLVVLGSIDIRHHIGRQTNPEASIVKLATKLAYFAFDNDIKVAAPVPIEYEERKIPKTGFYKGTPFTGTREDRLEWTMLFIKTLRDLSVDVVSPPESWYLMNPEVYAKEYMELSSSVHISPKNYRRNGEWNV
jgi:hypothetical protein